MTRQGRAFCKAQTRWGLLVLCLAQGLSCSRSCRNPQRANTLEEAASQEAGPAAAHQEPTCLRAWALAMETPILSETEWPLHKRPKQPRSAQQRSLRIGVLRQGTSVYVLPSPPQVKANCSQGWYTVREGGYVCGRNVTFNESDPRVRLAPDPPNTEAPLPFQYGYNLTNGMPLYRSVPSRAARLVYEPWLQQKKKPSPAAEELPKRAEASSLSPLSTPKSEARVDVDAGVPWYLIPTDGKKPKIGHEDLLGEKGTPIVRRMVRGFYLSLEKEILLKDPYPSKWWKTTAGLFVPFDRIAMHKPFPPFEGVRLNTQETAPPSSASPDASSEESPAAPASVAFVLSRQAYAYRFRENAFPPYVATQAQAIPRWTSARLTGKQRHAGGKTYLETVEGWWMRLRDGTYTEPGPPPKKILPGDKWIDVNVTRQTLVAFEGAIPVFATLVSTGREDPVHKDQDHSTPTGFFRVVDKYITATMKGGNAEDGTYSIQDVPWVMFYQGDYALHGAFWHQDFGHKHSHGCINLPPASARTLFLWSTPELPEGWYGRKATPKETGTWVVVHK